MKQPVTPDEAIAACNVFLKCVRGAGGRSRCTYGEQLRHWTKIVEVARKNGVSAERLIRARFSSVSPMVRASMTPASIYTPPGNVRMSLDCYDEDKCIEWPAIYGNMRTQLAGIASRRRLAPNSVLLDPMTSFYAWFRIAAMDPYEPRLAERCLDAAVAEVLDDLELRSFIKEKLDGRSVGYFAGRI